MEKDTAGCRAFHRIFIVGVDHRLSLGLETAVTDAQGDLQLHKNTPGKQIPQSAQLPGFLPPAEPAGRCVHGFG